MLLKKLLESPLRRLQKRKLGESPLSKLVSLPKKKPIVSLNRKLRLSRLKLKELSEQKSLGCSKKLEFKPRSRLESGLRRKRQRLKH